MFRREFPKIVVPSSKIVSFNPWFSLDFIAFLTNERCFDQNNSPRFDCLNPKKSGFPQICSIFGVEHPLLKLWDFKSWMVPDAHHFPCFGAFSPGITFQTTSKKQQNLDFFGCFHVFPKKMYGFLRIFPKKYGFFWGFSDISGAFQVPFPTGAPRTSVSLVKLLTFVSMVVRVLWAACERKRKTTMHVYSHRMYRFRSAFWDSNW